MPFQVNELVTGQIMIDGTELYLQEINSLGMLHISSGTQQTLPLLVFSFTDMVNQVGTEIKLVDGAQVTVIITISSSVVRNFRIAKYTRTAVGPGFSYTVQCYYDAPLYWMGTGIRGITGSSYEALRTIAQDTGLGFSQDNTPTSDTMLWMQGNRTYGAWADDIAAKGYAGDESHMVMGVTDIGDLVYVDVNSQPEALTLVTYEDVESAPGLKLLDFAPSMNSGLLNSVTGYRHVRQVQGFEGSSEDELTFRPQDPKLEVSSDVRSMLPRAGVSFSPIDWGTVHPKYERAKYQNSRFNALKSTAGSFLFGYQTDMVLLDNFKFKAPYTENDSKYDGQWSVKHKVLFIEGQTYSEKFNCLRQGSM